MQICYVDEAGDTGAFDPTNPLSQPVLVLTGVFIRQEQLAQLTRDVMLLKQRFFPNRKNIAPHWHDWLQVEVKGADLRRIREQAAKRIDAAKPIPELDGETKEVRELAEKLIAAHALPEKEVTDALHIATAAVHSMDYLLTWNCRHMANPHTLPLTREIVETAGYRCPAIITPSGFMELTEKGGDQ